MAPQLGMLVERLVDERLERVEQRRPELALRAHEPVALDGALDGVVVHAELGRDGADLPVLGEEQPPNACELLGVDHRATPAITSCASSAMSPSPRPSRRRRRRRGTSATS